MPYGLANLHTFVNEVFRDMLNHCMVIYIDDILIYSQLYTEHVPHISQVFRCLLSHGLFVKAKKCDFHELEIFLGYRLSRLSYHEGGQHGGE